jgi:hypothetical protein
MLLHILVMKVLPSLFEQHYLEAQEESHWEAWMLTIPGGAEILKSHSQPPERLRIGYLVADEARDAAAQNLFMHKQIDIPTQYS